MNGNLKRKLLAGLFVPVLGMAGGTALAQGAQGTAAGGTSPATAAKPATGTTGAGTSAMGGAQSGAPAAGGAQAGASGTASWNAQTFDRLDTNHDGKLSREEAQADAAVLGMWTQLDASNRGSVSKDDFERYRNAHASGAAGSKAGSTSGMSGGTSAPK